MVYTPPAFATKTSMGPSSCSTCWRIVAFSLNFVTSATTCIALPVARSMSVLTGDRELRRLSRAPLRPLARRFERLLRRCRGSRPLPAPPCLPIDSVSSFLGGASTCRQTAGARKGNDRRGSDSEPRSGREFVQARGEGGHACIYARAADQSSQDRYETVQLQNLPLAETCDHSPISV